MLGYSQESRAHLWRTQIDLVEQQPVPIAHSLGERPLYEGKGKAIFG